MLLRKTASDFGREVHSHRNFVNCRINPATSLHDALQTFSRDEKRSILGWLTKQGPFWEDAAEHNAGHWMECGDEIVTDTAVGEAVFCTAVGVDRRLVSFTPSYWNVSPITARIEPSAITEVAVLNYWQTTELNAALKLAEPPITSWGQMEDISRSKFQRLTFTTECFSYLKGQPFNNGVATRIRSRLDTLDRLMRCVDSSGQRTAEGNRLYQDHFVGDRAWFSDSSASEKDDFRNELTFPHPEVAGGSLFCTWHGKINHPPLRIHFAWPDPPGSLLYITYVGQKITRR